MKQPVFRNTLLVFINEKIIPVKISDIAFIHSAGGLVKVYAKDGRRYLISQVLDELEPQVNPYLFFRASRQFLINRDVIVMAEHFFNRRLVVKLSMETPERIIVSKMKAPELVAWMQR
ncbi:MAG: LytTR family transcriptional regulator [Niastella sp.]|nr:LytTR family transcriptional regulator [Niastella sp.]